MKKWLFALSGCIPLLALLGPTPDPTLLIYSLFVLVALRRHMPAATLNRWWATRFTLAIVGCGLLLECLAWTNNFLKCAPKPALLHPQLLPDLLLGVGFYGAWAIAWLAALRFFPFSPRQMFLTQGLFGIFIEQNGGILLTGLATLPLGLVLWLYVFLVYGSVMGIACRLAGLPHHQGQRDLRRKYPLAWLAILLLSLSMVAVWSGALQALSLVPTPQPICSNPLF